MSWLRNLQGQLSDLANEVLSEATEEVADPESELQVANKKCTEMEGQLVVEQTKSFALDAKVKDLEQQLYSCTIEMDAVGTKYGNMINVRDEEIKKLKIELEQARASSWDDSFDDSEQRLNDLLKEVAHWKSLVKQAPSDACLKGSSDVDIEGKLRDLQLLKDEEIAVLVEQHAHMLSELRESYEERISVLQGAASSSTSNVDLLDTVLLEKEELIEAKRRLEEMVNRKSSDEHPVVVELSDGSEPTDLGEDFDVANDLRIVISNHEKKIQKLTKESEDYQEDIKTLRTNLHETDILRRQNEELTAAYNDLNDEYENFKEQHGRVANRNNDLAQRIDYLKANLIEYEERYELCKRENAETVRQFEKLSSEFELVKSGFEEAKQKNAQSQSDSSVRDEVDRLRQALESSRTERSLLKSDLDSFRATADEINDQLNTLRQDNLRLTEYNFELLEQNGDYTRKLTNLSETKEQDLNILRSDFENYQGSLAEETVAKDNLIIGLRQEVDALKEKIKLLEDQTSHLNDVSGLLKEALGHETTRANLVEEKNILLESRHAQQMENTVPKLNENFADPAFTSTNESSEALTKQLSEALAAISEKTDECEKIRQHIDDLEKEVTVRQGCVDDLIIQNNLLQVQYQQAAEANNETKRELSQKEKEFLDIELQLVHLKDAHESLKREHDSLKTESSSIGEHFVDHSIADAQAKEARSMHDHVQSLETRVATLLEQVVSLTATCQQQDAICSELTEATRTSVDSLKRRHAEHVEDLSETHASIVTSLKAQNEVLLATVRALEQMTEDQSRVMENLKEAAIIADQRADQFNANSVGVSNDEISAARETIAQLNQENSQLKELATQKHAESVNFYERLESAVSQIGNLEKLLHDAGSRADILQETLKNEEVNSQKRARELTRLKEHLVLVEETSTREAIESEKRETELRALVKDLQQSSYAVTEGATESTSQYQQQITALTARVATAESATTELRQQYDSERKLRQQTADALSSLQGVVREISYDHEKESAAASHRALALQSELAEAKQRFALSEKELERLGLDKQAAEDNAESAREALQSCRRIVDDLETQLEEQRATSKKGPDSYRIDDATLRQLFLNYFTAAADKKREIAMLLASILEYPPDDMEKIRQSERTGAPPSKGRSSGPTISEQFIRFLENESESASTAPHLPISTDRAVISSESPVSSSNAHLSTLDDVLR